VQRTPSPTCAAGSTPHRFVVASSGDDGTTGYWDQDYPPDRHRVFWTDGNVNQALHSFTVHRKYYDTVHLYSWDTSTLAGLSLTSAHLSMCCLTAPNYDALTVQGQWIGGMTPVDATQYSSTAVGTAFSVPLSQFTGTNAVQVPVTPSPGISTTGRTGLRIGLITGAPTGVNELNCYAQDSDNKPALVVCAAPPTPTPTVTP
jgi:hypothetical protein